MYKLANVEEIIPPQMTHNVNMYLKFPKVNISKDALLKALIASNLLTLGGAVGYYLGSGREKHASLSNERDRQLWGKAINSTLGDIKRVVGASQSQSSNKIRLTASDLLHRLMDNPNIQNEERFRNIEQSVKRIINPNTPEEILKIKTMRVYTGESPLISKPVSSTVKQYKRMRSYANAGYRVPFYTSMISPSFGESLLKTEQTVGNIINKINKTPNIAKLLVSLLALGGAGYGGLRVLRRRRPRFIF